MTSLNENGVFSKRKWGKKEKENIMVASKPYSDIQGSFYCHIKVLRNLMENAARD